MAWARASPGLAYLSRGKRGPGLSCARAATGVKREAKGHPFDPKGAARPWEPGPKRTAYTGPGRHHRSIATNRAHLRAITWMVKGVPPLARARPPCIAPAGRPCRLMHAMVSTNHAPARGFLKATQQLNQVFHVELESCRPRSSQTLTCARKSTRRRMHCQGFGAASRAALCQGQARSTSVQSRRCTAQPPRRMLKYEKKHP